MHVSPLDLVLERCVFIEIAQCESFRRPQTLTSLCVYLRDSAVRPTQCGVSGPETLSWKWNLILRRAEDVCLTHTSVSLYSVWEPAKAESQREVSVVHSVIPARSARAAAPLDARAGYHAAARSRACRACYAPWPRSDSRWPLAPQPAAAAALRPRRPPLRATR